MPSGIWEAGRWDTGWQGEFSSKNCTYMSSCLLGTFCGHCFSSVIFNLWPVDTGMSMGYSPIYDGPPEEDVFAHCLCFHRPASFYKLVQELHVPPRHLPATMTFLGLADIRLPHRQPHHCQEGLKISGDFHGLSEHSWPPSTPLHTLGQVQLSRYVWSVATLSWKASAVLELPRT